MWDLEYLERAEGTVATPLGMCPLISPAHQSKIPSWITQHQEMEGIHEVEGIQDLEQGIFFRTTVELEFSSNWSPDSSWTLENYYFLNMIVSNATVYPRESNKNLRKTNTWMVPTKRKCRAVN